MIERNGKVALKYFQAIPQSVRMSSKKEYHFDTRRNISMAWVDVEDVEFILGIVKVCCGGNRNHPYKYANESDVRIWSGESER